MENMENPSPYERRSKSVWVGVIILCAGVLLLLRRLGVLIPEWVFTWPVVLIVIGLALGLKNSFRDFTSIVLIVVGAFLLARREEWISYEIWRFVWPSVIIAAGIFIIVRPKRSYGWRSSGVWQSGSETATEDTVDSIAVFYGARRSVTSKNFKGGEAVNIFGGTELNLNNADIQGTAVLDVVCIFGSVKLIVPPGWEVQIKVVHVFGGTDDKRNMNLGTGPKKILILTGTAIFGGIDVRSY